MRVSLCVHLDIPTTAAGWTWTHRTDGLRGLLHKQPRLVENQEEGLPGCGSASKCDETRGTVSLKKNCLSSLDIHCVT